jgi:hypothetical protein
MVRDLMTLAAASIMLGVFAWSILGPPPKNSLREKAPFRMETSDSLNIDPDLWLILRTQPVYADRTLMS